MAALDVVVQGAAVAQRDAHEAAFRLLGRLADRFRHFLGLALAEADAAALVTDHHERGEAEALATLHRLRHPVDRDETIGEFRGFLALAALPAMFTFCHSAFLACWRGIPHRYGRSWCPRLDRGPGSSGRRTRLMGRHPHSSELQPAFARRIGKCLDLAMEDEAATI